MKIKTNKTGLQLHNHAITQMLFLITLLFSNAQVIASTLSGKITGGLNNDITLSLLSYEETQDTNIPYYQEEILTRSGDGDFNFSSDITMGSRFSVAIKKQPNGQTCTTRGGSGTITAQNIQNITVSCNNLGLAFQDTDFDMYYIAGPIKILRAADESNISKYVLYFGGCAEPKYFWFLNQNICRHKKIVELSPTGSDITYPLSRRSVGWQYERFILLYTRDNQGHLSKEFKYVGKYVNECNKLFDITRASCGIDAVSDIIWQDKWINHMGSERVYPVERLYPSNINDLISTLRRARTEGKRVRMTGSGLSYSDVAVTKDILLHPTKLSGILPLDPSQLKNPSNPLLARVLSGTSIKTINHYLDQHNQAIGILGGYDGQTITGVTMTATHGSSLSYGPISQLVKSMQVVGEDGRVMQIEPTNGITEPSQFLGVLKENSNIPVTLIQDDDLFNAMNVSMGSMGIVYSVTLETEQKYWLHEERTILTWKEFKAPNGYLSKILNKSQFPSTPIEDNQNDPTYYEFQVNPYAKADGSHSVLLTKRWKHVSNIGEDAPKLRGQNFNNFSTVLVNNLKDFLVWLMDIDSNIAVNSLETALAIQADDSFNNVGYKVFNIGVANEIDVSAIELAFDVQKTVSVIERMFNVANTLRKKGIVHSVPLAGRFVKASNSMIAMQQGRDTLMVEIIVLNKLYGQRELFKTYEDTFMAEFGARPHWGLDMNIMKNTEWPDILYPKWNDWIKQYKNVNKGTFDGKFTDRLGISVNSD